MGIYCLGCHVQIGTESIPKLICIEHDWDDGVVTIAAACTENGLMTYTCKHDGCGGKRTEPIPATGHAYVARTITPTCENQGYTEYICSVCGENYIDENSYIDALGHDFTVFLDRKEATCAEAGYDIYECSRCEKTETIVIDKLDHVSGENTIIKEASCHEEGAWEIRCELCRELLDSGVIAKIAHIENTGKITIPANCVEEGVMTFKCTECGENLRTEPIAIDPSNHTGETYENAITSATCETDGEMGIYCSGCKVLLDTRNIPMLGHTWKFTETIEPTCTAKGYDIYTCENCGDVENRNYIDAFGHDFTVPLDHEDATCVDTGYDIYQCKRCDETDLVVIPALGHTEGEGIVTKDSTCTQEGEKSFYCEVCDEFLRTEKIPVKNHVEAEQGVETIPATCERKGEMSFYCSSCGTLLRTEDIPALGHDWVKGKTTAPTCTAQGYTSYECSICKNTKTDDFVSAFGHTEATEHRNATCTENGYTKVYCSVCKEVISYVEIPALGHTEGKRIVTKNPTIDAEGIMSFYCAVCNELLRTEAIPKLPAANSIKVNGVDIAFEIVKGAVVLKPTQTQMAAILKVAGNNIVFDLRNYESVDIYVDASCFKDIDKTITIITAKGSCEVKTKSLWNNSGKQRLITVRNGKLDFKNV